MRRERRPGAKPGQAGVDWTAVSLRITQVDAFTDAPFAGNPAAVCVRPTARDERWMQSVALEMNLSEAAFLVRQGDGFSLRWFTPAVEVSLCGDATLASAHVLWEEGSLRQAPGDRASSTRARRSPTRRARAGASSGRSSCVAQSYPGTRGRRS